MVVGTVFGVNSLLISYSIGIVIAVVSGFKVGASNFDKVSCCLKNFVRYN